MAILWARLLFSFKCKTNNIIWAMGSQDKSMPQSNAQTTFNIKANHISRSLPKVKVHIVVSQSSYNIKSSKFTTSKFKVHHIYIYIESIDPGRCRGQSLQYNYQNAAYTPEVIFTIYLLRITCRLCAFFTCRLYISHCLGNIGPGRSSGQGLRKVHLSWSPGRLFLVTAVPFDIKWSFCRTAAIERKTQRKNLFE